MFTNRWLLPWCLILLAGGQQATLPAATGQDGRGKAGPAAQSEDGTLTAKPHEADSAIPANLIVKLRERVGEKTTVVGHIERTSRSRGDHHFLNFSSSELTVVCFREHVGKFKDQPPADAFKNKDVLITGTIELYQGKLQIRLEDPSQIRIVMREATLPQRQVKLKQVATEVWVSPAGLRYAGRDPAGLTRVEHIGRHLKDQPERDGPHGVFEGGQGVAFALIDEAWQLAESRQLAPQSDGERSSYLVPLGRRIGYLGGREGKQRNHPPLQQLFIVFETGTKNIVTAFPR